MKRLLSLLTVALVSLTVAKAQDLVDSGVKISKVYVGIDNILSFDIAWPKTNSVTPWADSAWIFAEYTPDGINPDNKVRLPLLGSAATVTAAAPSVGSIIHYANNYQGFFVTGNAKQTAVVDSFRATVKVPVHTTDRGGSFSHPSLRTTTVCALATNYPPLATFNDDNTYATLTGTTGTFYGSITNGVVNLDGNYPGGTISLPEGYTLKYFSDATGAPGISKLSTVITSVCGLLVAGKIGNDNTSSDAGKQCSTLVPGRIGISNANAGGGLCAQLKPGKIGSN